jgi:O-phosphoseryl-tRNA(Cys) synthetase
MGTDLILYESLLDITKLLDAAGVELIINKINVNSEALAIKYKFVSSPTIRINGRDIQMEVKENSCKSCGDLCGDDVNCRVFIYQGNEYEIPPKAMVIEGILKEVYGVNQQKNEELELDYILPENLKKFYDAMKLKQI